MSTGSGADAGAGGAARPAFSRTVLAVVALVVVAMVIGSSVMGRRRPSRMSQVLWRPPPGPQAPEEGYGLGFGAGGTVPGQGLVVPGSLPTASAMPFVPGHTSHVHASTHIPAPAAPAYAPAPSQPQPVVAAAPPVAFGTPGLTPATPVAPTAAAAAAPVAIAPALGPRQVHVDQLMLLDPTADLSVAKEIAQYRVGANHATVPGAELLEGVKCPGAAPSTGTHVEQKAKRKFDGYATKCTLTHPSWKSGYTLGYFRKIVKLAAERLEVPSNPRVWESGCGCGHILLAAQLELGANTLVGGCDLSVPTIDFARELIPDGKLCATKFNDLSYVPDRTFTFSVSHGAFYYVNNEKEACQSFVEMARVTGPGGGIWIGHMTPDNKAGLFTVSGLPHSMWGDCFKRNAVRFKKLEVLSEKKLWNDGLKGAYSVFVHGLWPSAQEEAAGEGMKVVIDLSGA